MGKNILGLWGKCALNFFPQRFDPRKPIRVAKKLIYFSKEFKIFKNQMNQSISGNQFPFGKFNRCFGEQNKDGINSKEYFYQDFHVAKRILENKPQKHVDIGSRFDGFITHLCLFREVEVFDIRPLTVTLPGLRFIQADMMKPVDKSLYNYTDSISCLHAIEHFGLGRYGDPLDCDGHLKGLDNIYKILKPGGKFYLSVPIGPQRIEFNAHRIFSMEYLIMDLLTKRYKLDQFSYIDNTGPIGDFHENVFIRYHDLRNSLGVEQGCGIFEMTKI